ncbi:ImuA family protein [Sulfitobacter sp.]|jgi:protein ImuA|uniref:ImuA family protein n=1 Tax=Sulfitobacter sp. TaxID=1903071 RepID=UPI0035651BF8|tara:strand:+ start:2029 stop:2763 length:735 start_codon:yes stop_codon:yes gene_type:complete
MTPDSQFAQVISLSNKRLVKDVPTQNMAPHMGSAILRDALPDAPFDAAATGFVLACLPDSKDPVMWIQDRMSRRENGRLYGAALRRFGFNGNILRVEVSHPRDVLWAMEEGASCAGLSAVVGEIHGAPEVLSFTATKRLALRAENSGVPLWLIRSGDHGALSAARERWRLRSRPSGANRFNAQAPGAPVWEADLFRARGRAPGVWTATYDAGAQRSADRLGLVPGPGDGAMAADHHPASHATGG